MKTVSSRGPSQDENK